MATPFTKPAIPFTQTSRTGWLLTMTAGEITRILPAREPEQLYLLTDTNRPITPRHLGSIERFLADTPSWAMPAIILSVTPGTIKSLKGTITGDSSALQVLDGQHRLQAFSNTLRRLEAQPSNDEESKTRLDDLSGQELPVVIFEVESNSDHRQMFAWFARNRPIEPAVREFFDDSDPFGKVAKNAMEKSVVLTGRVTWKSKNVPPKGDEARKLLSLNWLKETVITIRMGVRKTPKQADRDACWQEDVQHELLELTVEFFDQFLPRCLPNYSTIDNLDELDRTILNQRSLSYALNPLVVRLIANAWARWKLDRKGDPAQLATVIGTLNLQMADPDNDLEGALGVVTGTRKKFEGLRKQAWETATTEIMRRAQEQTG